MRNPKSLKEGFGLPEYVAYANLRQGLRPFLRADDAQSSYVAVLVRYNISHKQIYGTEVRIEGR